MEKRRERERREMKRKRKENKVDDMVSVHFVDNHLKVYE